MTPEELESLRESVHEADPKIHAHVVRALLAMVDSLRTQAEGLKDALRSIKSYCGHQGGDVDPEWVFTRANAALGTPSKTEET